MWLGIDGEGLGRKPHRYVLLAASDVDGNVRSIENLQGLSTIECLEFLLQSPQNGETKLAGYYLGYDWTMILRNLSNRRLYRLLRPETRKIPKDDGGGFTPIRWKDYRIDYMNGMLRTFSKGRRVTVWDVGKFFQCPFIDAIDSWEIRESLALITEMKAKRETFAESDFDRIKEYCFEECKALARLCTALEQAHIDIDLKPRVWFGPGSTAAVALTRIGIKKKRGDVPKEVERWADQAFFGGRFEHSAIGTFDNVAGYDIASAYPFQAYHLPCLEHARWEYTTDEKVLQRADYACIRYHIHDIGRSPWGPLPCRLDNGSIVFPRGGYTGYAWQDEYRMAYANWPGIRFLASWILRSDCACHPFKKVLDWFRERVALGKAQKGRILKYVLNSLYGKLAQSVGSRQFASRVWAGMITSGTRAQLLSLLILHRDMRNCLALATDGLYSLECLPLGDNPIAGSTLGSWEAEYHGRMTFVRPGIYWSHDDGTLRARGVGRRQLTGQKNAVLRAIARGDSHADLGVATAFGGARACVYRTPKNVLRRSEHYGQWHEYPARISLDPAPKRQKDWSLWMLPGVESEPYRKDQLSDDARLLRMLGDIMWGMQ